MRASEQMLHRVDQQASGGHPRFKYLEVITGLFVAVLMISNIVSVKIVKLFTFTFDGGTILFPLSYIFGDILTEVYGYKTSRRVIWTGFGACVLMSGVFTLVAKMSAPAEWTGQEAYEKILLYTPRLVLASLIAYFCGEFSNSYVLAKMKILTHGRWLWTRTIGSTIVGEGVDTALFCVIAFYGTYSTPLLISILVSNYIFKCGFEAVATPVTYKIVGFLKRTEQIDYYDIGTNFNPFAITQI
jgi:uncharacterized integral membrane protein (TIGR00697 family)